MEMKIKQAKFTKKDFNKMFPDNDSCIEWLKNHLYPDGIFCPTCKKITPHYKLHVVLCMLVMYADTKFPHWLIQYSINQQHPLIVV